LLESAKKGRGNPRFWKSVWASRQQICKNQAGLVSIDKPFYPTAEAVALSGGLRKIFRGSYLTGRRYM